MERAWSGPLNCRTQFPLTMNLQAGAYDCVSIERESCEPGKTVLMVACQQGGNPNHLLHWRKLYQDGSLSAVRAGEEVVPPSSLSDALKQVRELQRMLGQEDHGERDSP
ncbi:hypothetical protein Cmtc_57470 [Cupriavidus sp. TKC]|jgi:Transposase|nr:insertion element protein [Cupriavidus sp. HMR-1]GMG94527.1 hypothetical protein Cmtc_57470 [Cupriavidus sp. TKC]